MSLASVAVAALSTVAVLSFGLMVLGLLRLPDVYARAHATSKADTLGTLAALSAATVAFGSAETAAKLAVLLVFLLVTGPTAAHAITRAARIEGYEPVGGDETAGESVDRSDAVDAADPAADHGKARGSGPKSGVDGGGPE